MRDVGDGKTSTGSPSKVHTSTRCSKHYQMMEYVVLVYCLICLQATLFVLYYTGYWCVVEFFFLLVKLQWIIFKSFVRKIIPSKRKSLKGEVALVTGGASGIGKLMSKLLAKKGKIPLLLLKN